MDGRTVSVNFTGSTSVFSDVKTYRFDFSWFREGVIWHASLRKILQDFLSTYSISHAHNCSYTAGRFAHALNARPGGVPDKLVLADFEGWPNDYGLQSWAFMQSTLVRWVKTELPGLAADVGAFLHSPEKWEEKGNGSYFALTVNSPERGAFTNQELKSIQNSINLAYETNDLSLEDWALVWFVIGTGIRPVQVARMTIGDVLDSVGPEGREVTLCIPLAKGRNAVLSERWKRKAPTVLAEVLLRYLDAHPDRLSPTTPLFNNQSDKIRARIQRIFDRLDTYSARLDGPIPIFPYRFRYTLGTRAVALGASDHEAARLLTHRTTHCIQYYRAAMPQTQEPIKAAIGNEMSFIAQAFQGRLINGLDEATRRGEPTALIRDFAHLMGQSIGACGTRAECHQDAPRACLTCRKFEPFRDAPWDAFLTVLREDLESETEDRIKLITAEQIEAVLGIMGDARPQIDAAQ